MAGIHLTANAINLLNGGDVDLRPVLQVMDVRRIGNSQSTQDRFRLVLSDGVFVQQAMMAVQLNEYVRSEQVVKGSIVRLVEYICNSVQNRKIIIVLNMEVLQSAAEIIGDPVNLATGAESLAGSGASVAHHQPQQSRGNESGNRQDINIQGRDIHIHFHIGAPAAIPGAIPGAIPEAIPEASPEAIPGGAPSQTPSPANASMPASNGNNWQLMPASNRNNWEFRPASNGNNWESGPASNGNNWESRPASNGNHRGSGPTSNGNTWDSRPPRGS